MLGPSGAGKSTLCYTLNGLIPHFLRGRMTGDVIVAGRNTRQHRVADLAAVVDLVFQDFESQLFSTNVELEVAFGPENLGLPRDEIKRRVASCLDTVGLTGLEQREPATLSGGQKQRLAIASVLSLQPEVLALDEATTDLDPLGRADVLAIVRELRRRGDLTLLVVEHETEEALHADRIVVLGEGRIVREGLPADVLADVDLCLSHGIRPLDTAVLRRELARRPATAAPSAPATTAPAAQSTAARPLQVAAALPLEENAAASFLQEHGFRLAPATLAEFAAADAERARRYGEPLLEVQGVHHTYPNGVAALHGADLTVRRGEFVAIVGQNGSGKTTLVKHFNGLLRPGQGRVTVCGKDTQTTPLERLAAHVGYAFQNPDHQIFAETVAEEVAFGPRNLGVPEPEVQERVAEALAAVELTGLEQSDPFGLTKGMRQRVAVASILAARPDILILDEPTTGLDYTEQLGMMQLLRRLNEAGHTVVCITHAMWVVAEYAHRMVVVHGGRIVHDGPTRAVMADEAALQAAHLRPPQAARLANALRREDPAWADRPALTALTAAELAAALVPGGEVPR